MTSNRVMVRRIAEKVTRLELSRRAVLALGWASSGNAQPRQIWLDQDGGWEDVAALAILLRSPDVEVLGITITPGIASPQLARERTQLLLEDLHETKARLVATIPADADVLATGPLTGVARLIATKRTPRRLTWMGGAISVSGNAAGGAEWNAAKDSRALRTVLQAKIPFTLCPLDLTNNFPSRSAIVEASSTRAVQEIRKAYGEPERSWWDELTAAYIAAPALFRSRELRLLADSQGRLRVHRSGTPVSVLEACDHASFEALLRSSLRF